MTISGQHIFTALRAWHQAGTSSDELIQLYHSLRNGQEIPPEIEVKINALLKGVDDKERNIAEEVRNWIELAGDYLSISDCYRELVIISKVDKNRVRVALHKLCEKGIIERYKDRPGHYRKVNNIYVEQEWWQATGEPLPVLFPLNIHHYAKIYNGNTILLEGAKSQGKTAFCIEFARLNRDLFSDRVLYQNVEMASSEILNRAKSYPPAVFTPEEMRQSIEFVPRTENWWDIVNPNGVNVIDYVVEYQDAYKVAQYIFNIHKKLKSGIALIVVQKDPNKAYGYGGYSIRNIPRLVISLQKHTAKLEDIKSFYNVDDQGNPTGMECKYKLVNWWKFLPADSGWKREED
jgi:hypothetical protein